MAYPVYRNSNMAKLAGKGVTRQFLGVIQRRYYALDAGPSQLKEQMTRRRLPLIYDYLSSQPSHLLNVSLEGALPKLASASTNTEFERTLPSTLSPKYMPIGHHLVYFPPQVPTSFLLPDGTDDLHSPGSPFNRRMWASGAVRFFKEGGPLLDGQRAVCVEGIRDVTVKGIEGQEKIFVAVERRIATVDERESEDSIRSRVWSQSEDQPGDSIVVERRDLIFMRDRTPWEIQAAKDLPKRIVKAPTNPEIRFPVMPSKALLFRYSALTFNAHSIHLDRDYARNTEGYRDLLVHGPLTFTIMITLFQNHMRSLKQTVTSIEYRNLAPLLVEQEMYVCAKPKSTGDKKSWEIWVEGSDGSLAVRGTVHTEQQR